MTRPDISRRSLLGGGLAALSVAVLAACGTDSESPAAGDDAASGVTPPSGPWTYTDDLGQEVSLDQAPVRIAAFGDAAAALINFGITPVAMFHFTVPSEDSTFEDIDLDGVEIVGEAYGEIDLEALAVAAPDLIVTTSYADDTPELMYGFKDETQMEKVRELAPVVGVLQDGTARDVIMKNEKLVASLGVDIEGGQVAEDRATFEAAAAALTKAAGRGLSVVPMYAESDTGAWYAKAPDDPALNYYAELGVNFVDVGGPDYYWHNVSWENADIYQPDVLLYSVRDSLSPEQLLEQPTFARLPAAENEQLHPWKFKSMDYPSQAAYMTELTTWLTEDEKVT